MKEELLYNYLYGRATDSEKEQILAWLDEAPQKHQQELTRIQYLFTATEHYWPKTAGGGLTVRSNVRRIFRYASGIAAGIAVMLGVWHLSALNVRNAITRHTETIEIPQGQYMSLLLEDGSKVWLNAGAKLEYPAIFDRKVRTVKLTGEAMFEVERDTKRPFIVETFCSDVKVLGTKFNVVADPAERIFETTLMEGTVKVTNRSNPAETMLMKPYDVVELIGDRLYKTTTTDFKDLCWTEGLIAIKRMPFGDLMARFEKAYNVKIVIEREKMPEIRVMSGEIRISDGIDYALQVLQQVSDFTYHRDMEKNVIVIR